MLTLARNELAARGITVEERALTLDELKRANECFCCGTGASITPVGSVSIEDDEGGGGGVEEINFFANGTKAGPITQELFKMLFDIQWGTGGALSDKYADWIHVVAPKKAEKGRK